MRTAEDGGGSNLPEQTGWMCCGGGALGRTAESSTI